MSKNPGPVVCTTTADCVLQVHALSECLHDKLSDRFLCSNPFASGCFHSLLGPESPFPKRVCHSYDTPETVEAGLCRQVGTRQSGGSNTNDNHDDNRSWTVLPDYPEVRLFCGNWESNILDTWILQVLLSEVLEVPASIDIGSIVPTEQSPMDIYSTTRSYDPGSRDFSKWEGLEHAADIGDCRSIDGNQVGEAYRSCNHVSTEVWTTERAWEIAIGSDNINEGSTSSGGYIEPPQALGLLSQEGWYIPQYTARNDTSLIGYWGLSGQREKIASTFLRPTTWGDYCREGSLSNCSVPDQVALRPPLSENESTLYFYQDRADVALTTNITTSTTASLVEDGVIFSGFFRATADNDCETWPDNCTGHIVDYPCGWTSHAFQQAYHLNIAVKGNGREGKIGGYKGKQMRDIWMAANYTKSHVLMYWWQPDRLFDRFAGTDAEFTKIAFPTPTQECEESRVAYALVGRDDLRCFGETLQERVGDAVGSCDDPPLQIQKVVSKGLYKMVYDENIVDAIRSPAYDAIQLYTITRLQLDQVFKYWKMYGDPREAVCHWIVDNEDWARQFIPSTYPRAIQQIDGTIDSITGLGIFALALASVTVICILVTSVVVYKRRNSRVIQSAQLEFVALILFGLLITALGAVVAAIPASDGTCVAAVWTAVLGWTIQLVPLLVKISAVNMIFRAAARHRRVVLKRRRLFMTVVVISSCVGAYLILWTVLDAPQKRDYYSLTEYEDQDSRTVVELATYCSSENAIWSFLVVGWNGILVLAAVVLAYQSREIKLRDFNESVILGLMAYTKGVLLVLRVIVIVFVPIHQYYTVLSIVYSVESIVTCSIYFLPKFFSNNGNSRLSTWVQSARNISTQYRASAAATATNSRDSQSRVPPEKPPSVRDSRPDPEILGANIAVDAAQTKHVSIESGRSTSCPSKTATCEECGFRWLPSCCPDCGRSVTATPQEVKPLTEMMTTVDHDSDHLEVDNKDAEYDDNGPDSDPDRMSSVQFSPTHENVGK